MLPDVVRAVHVPGFGIPVGPVAPIACFAQPAGTAIEFSLRSSEA